MVACNDISVAVLPSSDLFLRTAIIWWGSFECWVIVMVVIVLGGVMTVLTVKVVVNGIGSTLSTIVVMFNV